jgi:hypothetical protein
LNAPAATPVRVRAYAGAMSLSDDVNRHRDPGQQAVSAADAVVEALHALAAIFRRAGLDPEVLLADARRRAASGVESDRRRRADQLAEEARRVAADPRDRAEVRAVMEDMGAVMEDTDARDIKPVAHVERSPETRKVWFPNRELYEQLDPAALEVVDDFAWTIFCLRAGKQVDDVVQADPGLQRELDEIVGQTIDEALPGTIDE